MAAGAVDSPPKIGTAKDRGDAYILRSLRLVMRDLGASFDLHLLIWASNII
jgi:hypothetical protein